MSTTIAPLEALVLSLSECVKVFMKDVRYKPHRPEDFIRWDETENAKQALDWDRDKNFWAGLREQARQILVGYTRCSIEVAGSKISVPAIVSTADGYKEVVSLSPEEYRAHLRRMVEIVRRQAQRAKVMGANYDEVKAALRAAGRLIKRDFAS